MKYLTPSRILRFALGATFLYVGVYIFVKPDFWIGFVPGLVESFFIPREIALYLHGAGDIALGILFLSGKWRRLVGWAGFLWLAGITAFSGPTFLTVTFRDVGLALAALAYGQLTDSDAP